MRCLVQIGLLLVLFSFFKLQAEVAPTWVTNSLEGEVINTLFTYEGVLLLGGKKGAYYGIKMYLDGGDEWGYPDYEWEVQQILSGDSSSDDSVLLKNSTSMAILDNGRVYAVSDSGLFHIALDHFSHTDEVKNWYRDETFTGTNMKLKGSGDKIFILVDNRLYYKTKSTEWTLVPSYIGDPLIETAHRRLKGLEREIHDFTISGKDIVIKIASENKPLPQAYDLYVSIDLGESWIPGAKNLQMVGDFTTYRTFWNDENPDLVYNANDTWNGKSNIYFCEDIQSTDADIPVKVVHKELNGTLSSIGVSSLSKSGIPLFYVATNNGVYTCGADYEFNIMKEQPEIRTPIYVASMDSRELLTYAGSKLCYYVNWYGSTTVLKHSTAVEKSLYSITNSHLLISDAVHTVSLYNIVGQEITTLTPGALRSVDISDFAKGCYIAKFQTENGMKCISFIK